MRISPRFFLTVLVIAGSFSACSKAETVNLASVGNDTGDGPAPSTISTKVIYGDDNRHEVFAEKDASVRALAESTVALVKSSNVGSDIGGLFRVSGEAFGSSYGLCPTERFVEQETAAFCSGFLIAPNLIATAGHCIRSALDCSETSFVFDYAYKSENSAPLSTTADNLYRCKNVIHTEVAATGADFAIIELDRSVVGRTPVALRQSGELQVGEDLTVIGHPAGLPTKIADGAKTRNTSNKDYFVANLDTYGGNSGSAVFNTKTHEVEGILVRGETDFVWSPKGCSVSYVCLNDGCRGEDVTKISAVTDALNSL